MTEVAVSDVRAWEAIASQAFVPLKCTDRGAGFSAALQNRDLHRGMALTRVQSDAVLVERTASLAKHSEQDELHLSVQLRSTGRVHQHDRVAELQPGSAALYETNQPYVLEYAQHNQDLLVFKIPRHELGLSNDLIRALCARTIDRSAPGMAAFSGFLLGMLNEQASNLPRLLSDIGHLGRVLLATVLESFASQQPVLGDVDQRLLAGIMAHVRNQFDDPTLSVERLAQAHHISVRKLYELFATVNETPGRYLQHIRLEYAAAELQKRAVTHRTIESIALTGGFSSAATFTRAFKQTYGVPPSQWLA